MCRLLIAIIVCEISKMESFASPTREYKLVSMIFVKLTLRDVNAALNLNKDSGRKEMRLTEMSSSAKYLTYESVSAYIIERGLV